MKVIVLLVLGLQTFIPVTPPLVAVEKEVSLYIPDNPFKCIGPIHCCHNIPWSYLAQCRGAVVVCHHNKPVVVLSSLRCPFSLHWLEMTQCRTMMNVAQY